MLYHQMVRASFAQPIGSLELFIPYPLYQSMPCLSVNKLTSRENPYFVKFGHHKNYSYVAIFLRPLIQKEQMLAFS